MVPNPDPGMSPAFHKPHSSLLSSHGMVNGEPAKILLDDGALTNLVSFAFVKRLGIGTDVSSKAALMPDGSTYNLMSTKDPL